jgi:hypothetical protein
MSIRKVLSAVAALALIISLAPLTGSVVHRGSFASPLLKVGPQALAAGVAGPNYSLFTCQVVNLNPGTTVTTLIRSGMPTVSTRSSTPALPVRGRQS